MKDCLKMISSFFLPFLIITVPLFLFCNNVLAALSFNDAVFPEFVTSSRALATGNAYIALANDASATMYNPAGLGSIRTTHFHITNISVEVNKAWADMGTSGFITTAIKNVLNGFSLNGIRTLVVNNKGKISNTRFQAMPNFTTRFLSLGFLYSVHLKGTLGTSAGSLFEYASRTDIGPFAGLNFSFWGGIIKIGATVVLLNRTQYIGDADPNITLSTNSVKQSGSSMQVISGLKFTLPIKTLPIFALKMNNSTNNVFSQTGVKHLDAITQSIDAAFSITPRLSNNTRLNIEVDYRDVLNKYALLSNNRRLAVGMELEFNRSFFIRAGYGDGFGSAGLGVKSQKVEFDFTTYAVDTTSNSFKGKEDRRYSFGLSSGF